MCYNELPLNFGVLIQWPCRSLGGASLILFNTLKLNKNVLGSSHAADLVLNIVNVVYIDCTVFITETLFNAVLLCVGLVGLELSI